MSGNTLKFFLLSTCCRDAGILLDNSSLFVKGLFIIYLVEVVYFKGM